MKVLWLETNNIVIVVNNETIDYTLICNDKQEIVLNNIRTVIIGVSVIKRLSLYEFSLWGRDFVSVVRIIEGLYYRGYFYKECVGIFPGPRELSVSDRGVRVRGSTVEIIVAGRMGQKIYLQ